MIERTLILIKPDAVQRGLIGEIITRFEKKGLKICGMKMLWVTKELAEKHYKEHKGKYFYDQLIKFITSGPLVAMVIEGVGAIQVCRKMAGKTFGIKADPGTIRGDYGISTNLNLVHSAENEKAAEREISIFFKPEEIISYEKVIDKYIYNQADVDLITKEKENS